MILAELGLDWQCMYSFFLTKKLSSLTSKKETLSALNEWWEKSLVLDPIKLDAIDFAAFKSSPDDVTAFAVRVCYLTSRKKGKAHVKYDPFFIKT